MEPKQGIDEFDAMLRAANATFNAFKIGETIMRLMQINPSLTLDKIEERFRALGVKTHLVARPAKIAPPNLRIVNPITGEPAQFWLWICLHGKAEAGHTIWMDNLALGDNLANLKEAGFLVAGQGLPGLLTEKHDA